MARKKGVNNYEYWIIKFKNWTLKKTCENSLNMTTLPGTSASPQKKKEVLRSNAMQYL